MPTKSNTTFCCFSSRYTPHSWQSDDMIFYLKPNPNHPKVSNKRLAVGNTPGCNPPTAAWQLCPHLLTSTMRNLLPFSLYLTGSGACSSWRYCPGGKKMTNIGLLAGNCFKCTPPPCRAESEELKGDVRESSFHKRPRNDTNKIIRPSNQACTSGTTISSFHLTRQ